MSSHKVYENNDLDGISFETICSNVPKSIGSRSSIQSILMKRFRNLFKKYQSKKDKELKTIF